MFGHALLPENPVSPLRFVWSFVTISFLVAQNYLLTICMYVNTGSLGFGRSQQEKVEFTKKSCDIGSTKRRNWREGKGAHFVQARRGFGCSADQSRIFDRIGVGLVWLSERSLHFGRICGIFGGQEKVIYIPIKNLHTCYYLLSNMNCKFDFFFCIYFWYFCIFAAYYVCVFCSETQKILFP